MKVTHMQLHTAQFVPGLTGNHTGMELKRTIHNGEYPDITMEFKGDGVMCVLKGMKFFIPNANIQVILFAKEEQTMLKKLLQKIKSLFTKPPASTGPSKPYMGIGEMDGNVKIERADQLTKRTHYKIGESYRLGEMIVTLRSSKAEVAKILAAVDARRLAREVARKERGIELMLMKPEELMKLKIDEWLKTRNEEGNKLSSKMGIVDWMKRYVAPRQKQIAGSHKERWNNLVEDNQLKQLETIGHAEEVKKEIDKITKSQYCYYMSNEYFFKVLGLGIYLMMLVFLTAVALGV